MACLAALVMEGQVLGMTKWNHTKLPPTFPVRVEAMESVGLRPVETVDSVGPRRGELLSSGGLGGSFPAAAARARLATFSVESDVCNEVTLLPDMTASGLSDRAVQGMTWKLPQPSNWKDARRTIASCPVECVLSRNLKLDELLSRKPRF